MHVHQNPTQVLLTFAHLFLIGSFINDGRNRPRVHNMNGSAHQQTPAAMSPIPVTFTSYILPAEATAISPGEFSAFRSLVVGSYLKISHVPQENPQQSTPVDVNLLLLKMYMDLSLKDACSSNTLHKFF